MRETLIQTTQSVYEAKTELNDYLSYKNDSRMGWNMFAELRGVRI